MFKIFSGMKHLIKARDSTTTVIIHRLNIPIKLKSLSFKEIMIIALNYVYENIDETDLSAELIIAATANFNWNDAKLLKEYKANNGNQVVTKILLAGEMTLLAEKILKISIHNILRL